MPAKKEIHINIVTVFGCYLGGRFKGKDGEFTGEAFRDDCLIPELQKLKANQILVLDFSGCRAGIATSFLDEAFIKIMVQGYKKEFLEKHIAFKGASYLRDKIKLYGGPTYQIFSHH